MSNTKFPPCSLWIGKGSAAATSWLLAKASWSQLRDPRPPFLSASALLLEYWVQLST